MEKRKVLISGASIAGPALAFWLARYGYQPTIVERAPALRPGGYAVDFRGAAMRVLERMGLIDEIRRFETRTGAITLVDKDNRKIASMPDGFTSGELEILRGDLARVLYEATHNTTEYIFGDSIAALCQRSDGVDVEFARGASRRFDLVIGADGLHSNVRVLAFGDESRFVHNLGYSISIFTVPNYLKLNHTGLYYCELGKRVGIFCARDVAQATASFFFASPPLEHDQRDVAAQKRILRDAYAGCGWEAPRLLALMDDAPDFYFDSISQVRMNAWSNGRVALVGDAAACPSPVSGMGTSLAIVGAYILAGELRRAGDDVHAAFLRYEARMQPFAAECQKLAEGVEWFVPTTRTKLWLSQQMWKILPHTPWKNMMIEMPLKVGNSITVAEY